MIFKNTLITMQKKAATIIEHVPKTFKDNNYTYEAAVNALNQLQSNAEYLKSIRNKKTTHEEEYARTIKQMEKYLVRSGITFEDLDKLSVIHVTGTKGKGSTCSYCESILRHNGFRTGFFSSPHLLEVRERIRIDGVPLQKQIFSRYFWDVYNKLQELKSNSSDMPLYFRFLTIMAFHVFLKEKVDVAIVEVGIGGEYDCTNVLKKVDIAGITSLGLDHTTILGNTIEQIAWHKGGIIKPGCEVFTVPQPKEALEIIRERSKEQKCDVQIVYSNLDLPVSSNPVSAKILNANANLAFAMAAAWMKSKGVEIETNASALSETTQKAISESFWPGRYEVLRHNNITYFLDGAHTNESIKICAEWFQTSTDPSHIKVLLFNVTGERNSTELLKCLHHCNFQKVYFVPNKSVMDNRKDHYNYNITEDQQMIRCQNHHNIWFNLDKEPNHSEKTTISVLPTVMSALNELPTTEKCDVLITGSIHLIGAALSILDPNLKGVNRVYL